MQRLNEQSNPQMNDQQRQIQFDLFYAEHATPGYRFALRLCGNHEDAEDIVADALVKAFSRWSQYRGEADARTWLFKIVLNEWRMRCRKRSVQVVRLESIEHMANTMDSKDFGLATAILSLSRVQREAFLLVKGEGLTHAEAAKVAGVPIGTMYFRVHSAVNALRRLLSETPMDPAGSGEVNFEAEM